MFLFDSDNKPTHIELNCVKLHQPGCSGYIESIPDDVDPDITVLPIPIIATYHMPTVVNGSSRIERLFQLVKKIDRKSFFKTIHIKRSKKFH